MDDRWRARVDTTEGVTLGAGFLVDARHLLTCAHVVRDRARVLVTFPGVARDLAGEVLPVSSWKHLGDPGDIAVVRLLEPVSIVPAKFARPEALHDLRTRKLRAHGFRYGHEQSGTYITLSTDREMVLSGEWLQVEVLADHLEHLAAGFSGAAAYFLDTGEVVGMLTDADLEAGGRIGRVLPLNRMRRYWEDLDDLLPLSWLAPADRQSLRVILQGARSTMSAGQVHANAFPEFAVRPDFTSLWDAVRYVAEEQIGDSRLERFLGALVTCLPRDSAEALDGWIQRVLRPLARVIRRPGPSSIVVRLEPRTHRGSYDLSLRPVVDGEGRPGLGPVEVRTEADVRRYVEQALPALMGTVLGRDWMIEFALPEAWLGKPYDEWYIDKGKRIRMRAYPLVVRDVERLRPAVRRDLAGRRWRTLRDRRAGQPHPVGCRDAYDRGQFQSWLEAHDEICVLVFASRPEAGRVSGALNVGMPVMLWRRSNCGAQDHSGCGGMTFMRDLIKSIDSTIVDELPLRVRKLRLDAADPTAGGGHCGQGLTLFWDDPGRMPDPPLSMGALYGGMAYLYWYPDAW